MSTSGRKNEFIKSTLILGFGKLTSQFLSFFMLLFYTRYLTAEEFGLADLLNTYASILIIIVGSAVDLGIFRFYIPVRDNSKNSIKVFSSALSVNILFCLFYSFLFLLFKDIIEIEYSWYLLFLVVINIFYNTFLQFSRAMGRNITFSISVILTSFITILSGYLFIIIFKKGVYGFLLSVIIGQLVSLIYLSCVTHFWNYFRYSLIRLRMQFDILKYSFPLAITQLLFFLINGLDKIYISQVYGLEYNGVFALAVKISSVLSVVFSIVLMSATESVVIHFNDNDFSRFFSLLFNRVFDFFFLGAILLLLIVSVCFSSFFDQGYENSYYYIPILVLAALLQVVSGILSTIFLARKNSTETLLSTVLSIFCKIVIILLFSKFFHLYAIAFSTVGAFLIISIKRYLQIAKHTYIDFSLLKLLYCILCCFLIGFVYYQRNLLLSLVMLFVCSIFVCWRYGEMIKSTVLRLLIKKRKNNV